MLQHDLMQAGYTVTVAGTVGEGWSLLSGATVEYHAAVIGTDLPVIFGWELVNRIRNHPRFVRTPVLVLADELAEGDVDKADSLHCGYLSKPLTSDEIISKVRSFIREAIVAETREVKVHILTDVSQVVGILHLPPHLVRFTDGLESLMADDRAFIPVTEARITHLPTGRLIAETYITHVPKTEIRGVIPSDAIVPEGTLLDAEALSDAVSPDIISGIPERAGDPAARTLDSI